MGQLGEDGFVEILERHRVSIVQRLQLDRSFLFDYLRSKCIFDRTDCDHVLAEKTRDLKASKFLDILLTKGEEGFQHFVDALQLLNPGLYEQITGEKASAKPNPIMTGMTNSFLGDGRMPDVDIMSSQLQRTISDLNDLTLRYQEVLKERQDLGKKLDQAESDLEVKHKRVEELERQKSETTTEFLQAYTFANTAKESVVCQLQSLHRDLQERNTYIIALQMKLLSSQEKIDSLKNQLIEIQANSEKLHSQLHEVTRNYDHQRRESIKLCERLETQKGDMKKYDELKKSLRQEMFNRQKAIAERDDAAEELNELKGWCEALKSRYDIVDEERKQIQESHESKAKDNANLRYRIDELELRLSLANREIEDYKKTNADLEESVKKIKEQRDSFAGYRKEAMTERDSARAERDEAVRKYNDLLTSRDEMIAKHAEHSKHFEEQSQKATSELKQLQKILSQTELEYEELRRSKMERDEDEDEDDKSSSGKKMQVLGAADISQPPKANDFITAESDSPLSETLSEDFNWKSRRETTELIESMKRRFNRQNPLVRQLPVKCSLDSPQGLDYKLKELMPEIEQLSEEAKKSLSLERNRNLFKTEPQFDQLAHMFPICSTPNRDGASFGTSPLSSVTCSGGDWKPDAVTTTASGKVRKTEPLDSSTSSDSGLSSLPRGDSNSSFESEIFEQETKQGNSKTEPKNSPTKPPYLKSLSSPPGTLQTINTGKTKLQRIQINGKVHFHGNGAEQNNTLPWWGDEEKSRLEVEKALESPSIKEPFRSRLQAFHFKEKDRPRSTSLPPQHGGEADTENDEDAEASGKQRKISCPLVQTNHDSDNI